MDKKSNKSYDLMDSKDLEILNNKILDIKRSLRLSIAKMIKDLDYEFPIDTSQGDKCFGECVKLINIKCDLENIIKNMDKELNNYVELEQEILFRK